MANYLIPYVDPKRNDGEEDPMFHEFTYGDKGSRGKKLLTTVKKGDFLFFHTSINRNRYITAFYEVETVMPIEQARQNPLIAKKYQNPHLLSKDVRENEVIVFGHSIHSFELVTPLEIDEDLMDQLGIPFDPYTNPTVFGSLTSKLRNWCTLDDDQVHILMEIIFKLPQVKVAMPNKQLSSTEIPQLLERDIEDMIANLPELIGPDLLVKERQYAFKNSNKRLDLLLENNRTGELTIVEIKKDAIDLNALSQLKSYVEEYREENGASHVNAVLVGNGVLPYFEEQIVDKVRKYGWRLLNYGWLFSLEEPYKEIMDGNTQFEKPLFLFIRKPGASSQEQFALFLENRTEQLLWNVNIHVTEHQSEDGEVFIDNYVKSTGEINIDEVYKISDMTSGDFDYMAEYAITAITSDSLMSVSFQNNKLRNVLDYQAETGEEGWLIPVVEMKKIPIAKIARVLFKGQHHTVPTYENKYYATLLKEHPQIEDIMAELYKSVDYYYRSGKASLSSEIAGILQEDYKIRFEHSEGSNILIAYCEAIRDYFRLPSEDVARMFMKYAV